jgi:hypothetical protein
MATDIHLFGGKAKQEQRRVRRDMKEKKKEVSKH